MRSLLVLAASILLAAAPPTPIQRCVEGLTTEVGANPDPELIQLIINKSDPVDPGLILSIVAVESAFNPSAKSDRGAIGLMQVTPAALIDAAKFCGLFPVSPFLLTMPHVNIRYGTCYLRMWQAQTRTTHEALIGYNGGYRQWENYKAGRPLAPETAEYVFRVELLKYNHCPQTRR